MDSHFILIDYSICELLGCESGATRAGGDRIAEMKINTGIYIFCSPAWLARVANAFQI